MSVAILADAEAATAGPAPPSSSSPSGVGGRKNGTLTSGVGGPGPPDPRPAPGATGTEPIRMDVTARAEKGPLTPTARALALLAPTVTGCETYANESADEDWFSSSLSSCDEGMASALLLLATSSS